MPKERKECTNTNNKNIEKGDERERKRMGAEEVNAEETEDGKKLEEKEEGMQNKLETERGNYDNGKTCQRNESEIINSDLKNLEEDEKERERKEAARQTKKE